MIAERPAKNNSAVDEVENLFDGLSFPEVPTAPIMAPATRAPESAKLVPVLQRPESKPVAEVAVPQNLNVSESKKTSNLSSLYATEIITSDSHNAMYPELPSFADHLIEENDNTSSAYAYNSSYAEQSEETASLLPRQSSAAVPISSSAQAYGNPLLGGREHEQAPELVTDLVRENTRLADEVANLKRILQDQQQQQGSGAAAQSAVNVQAHPQHQQQVMQQHQGLQLQQQQQQGMGVAQSPGNTITGVHVTDTTRPPEKGVKYVCCGGCRQWLMAPRDAVYVVCGTCDSINNCNLAPKDSTVAHTRAAETRAMTQRNGNNNNMFWFLDCFSRGLF